MQNPPAEVQDKLQKWGVSNHKSIFSRALGLNVILADVPPQEMLSAEFLRHYHRYADQMFHAHLGQMPFADPEHLGFDFEIFASGEYSRMLEKGWADRPRSRNSFLRYSRDPTGRRLPLHFLRRRIAIGLREIGVRRSTSRIRIQLHEHLPHHFPT